MASTLATPIAQAVISLFDGNLGKLLNYGYRPGYGILGATLIDWTPADLFLLGEQGAWYDPSDFSTMYQDSAGTTPVTAVEQPVGLMLDKSKGLVLGSELVTNGGFDSNVTGWAATGGATIAYDATSGGLLLDITGPGGRLADSQTVAVTAGKSYLVTARIKAGTYSGTIVATFDGVNNVITPSSAQYTDYRWVYVAPDTDLNLTFGRGVPATGTVFFDNISVRELPGNHASQSTASSRPVLKQDGNGKYYLLFDGVDDSLSTASIDFSATDKMSVFAGVRKLSDANIGIFCELSNTIANNGTFAIAAPDSSSRWLRFMNRGTIQQSAEVTLSVYLAPTTNVLTGIGDISGDSAILRVNAIQAAINTGDQGTGNYGNYPIFIGRRAGTSLPFSGHLYSLIIRGAQSTDAQIVSAETYVNSKTGAY